MLSWQFSSAMRSGHAVKTSTFPVVSHPPFPVLGDNKPLRWRWSWWWGRKPRWCKRWPQQTSAIWPSTAHWWAPLPASHGGSDNRTRNMTLICKKNKIISLYTHRIFYRTLVFDAPIHVLCYAWCLVAVYTLILRETIFNFSSFYSWNKSMPLSKMLLFTSLRLV